MQTPTTMTGAYTSPGEEWSASARDKKCVSLGSHGRREHERQRARDITREREYSLSFRRVVARRRRGAYVWQTEEIKIQKRIGCQRGTEKIGDGKSER